MSQDRLQCKECGNTDSTKFTLFDNAFICKICGAINPLYDTYNIVKHIHSGKVEVDGVSTVGNLLARARQLLAEDKYDNALKLYKKVLENDFKNHIALWGCYCCEKGIAAYYRYSDKYGNSGPYVKANILCDLINRYGAKAIQNAPEQYASAYKAALKEDLVFIDRVRKGIYQ